MPSFCSATLVSLLFSFPLEAWPTCPFLGLLAGCCDLLLRFPLSLGIFTAVFCWIPSRHLVPTVGVLACWIDFPVCLGWSQPHKRLTFACGLPLPQTPVHTAFVVSASWFLQRVPNPWTSSALPVLPAQLFPHTRDCESANYLRDLETSPEHLGVEGIASAQSELREEISGRLWEETQL